MWGDLWDDISAKVGEIEFEDVKGLFETDKQVNNQPAQIASQQAAQPEIIRQPVHASTTTSRPVVVQAEATQAQIQQWYQDPLKAAGAAVAGLVAIVAIVKLVA